MHMVTNSHGIVLLQPMINMKFGNTLQINAQNSGWTLKPTNGPDLTFALKLMISLVSHKTELITLPMNLPTTVDGSGGETDTQMPDEVNIS